MKSKLYTIFGIVFLSQVLFVTISEARLPPYSHWRERNVRDHTDKKFADNFSVSVTLYNIAQHIRDNDTIAKARSCYKEEENNYKNAVLDFTEKINSIYNNIKDKYQKSNGPIVAKIQTAAYNLLNHVRNNPFELDVKLKPGKVDKFHGYMTNLKVDVSHYDYEFDISMQLLLQQRYTDNKLTKCDDEIIKVHTEVEDRCNTIMKNIENCLAENLEKNKLH